MQKRILKFAFVVVSIGPLVLPSPMGLALSEIAFKIIVVQTNPDSLAIFEPILPFSFVLFAWTPNHHSVARRLVVPELAFVKSAIWENLIAIPMFHIV